MSINMYELLQLGHRRKHLVIMMGAKKGVSWTMMTKVL